MKKLCILFTLLMVVVLFPSFSGKAEERLPDDGSKTQAAITYTYCVTYPYYANTGDWWTGLAVLNDVTATSNFAVWVYDSSGSGGGGQAEIGIFTLDGWPAQKVGLLSSFVTSGSIHRRVFWLFAERQYAIIYRQ